MKSVLLLLLTLSLTPIYAQSSRDCEEFLDSCEYYACINSQKKCGKKSYFEKFGKKYCNKFSKNEASFSSDGQSWIEDTKVCLIASIEQLDESLTCKEYKAAAIKQHVPCYVDSGYCSLSKKDKLKVVKTIIASMWRPSLVSSALKVLKSCKK